ncbi:hypothetical protein TTHERM_01352090 (macronuclear) [Tetrahymena thermophila SB210]|uniref:Uncharacterized protein n=1 Tax=Tetrahymena thermophila (strain SB210) TaxID=312017 RepID=Q23KN9_TETTS|nr:hypothetical protein TTHERM_01352090 [Tetrahymena thermophila SB210]EAR97080.2 hypothetical protein TTHERM_01352090 [Tetrahymena thermophila SB210]|eukprot:XP_001017325.2 hypothetical protein TTHERM_01352090 [Tetrahymena thermophila SB210]
MVNPSNYQIDEQVILVVENKSECETISSQIECSVKKQQTFIQNYEQQIAEQNEKVKPLVQKSLLHIQNDQNIQKNIELLILNQYIKKFQQNGFSYKIITIQQIQEKDNHQINILDSIGTFCESIIIQ